jgi:glucoside 3-dehydrogenase (cytochrome c) hitch-hiker subunit
MNRRKAIIRITLAGTGLAAAFTGYKWYDITKGPDLVYLDNNRELLGALAETIIPATDTPGAKEAGVGDFIVMMIRECTGVKEQNKFIDGLKDLQGYCRSEFGKPYQSCNSGEQEKVLTHFEKKGRPMGGLAGKVQNRYLGKSFFTILKDYTVEGYCTSEQGATRGLAYMAVPGSFHGCIAMQSGQKAWATS